jgi:cell division inhibitor SepF
MSNPLKKTMVYLGLADEELEHEAAQAAPAPAAPIVHAAAPAPAPKTGAAVTPLRKHQVPPEHTAGGDERDPHRAPASVP